MRHVHVAIVLLGVGQLAVPALAARKDAKEVPDEEPAKERAALKEAKEKAAKKACLNGDPARGVEILTDLFVDTNDPTYIFNQGRCYEQNDRYEEAIGRFREYLRKTPGRNESDRADVQQHIVDCEALLAKKNAEAQAPAPPPAPPVAPPPAPATPLPPPAYPVAPPMGAERTVPQGTAQPGSGLRVAGVITMIAGAAGLVTGVALNLKYNDMMDDLKPGESSDSARTYLTWSLVGYGAGGALLAGGLTMYLVGYSARHAAVAPAVVAGRPGAMVMGQF